MLRYAAMALLVLTIGRAALAEDTVTDVNIVTALDISNSISLEQMELELDGMAQAIRDPRVLRAIQAGQHRRIGFAVFAWHHNSFPSVVAWSTIGSRADADAIARTIEARKLIDVELEGREQIAWYIGRLTDLSQALDHAGDMLLTAPFAADRAVINVIGNGKDNVAEDANLARERIVARGGTINGVVLGNDPVAIEYYRQQVIGGAGAFVMTAADRTTLADAFARKFIGDIVAALDAGNPGLQR
jgi:Ca-activated chloride channel homolog